MAGPSRRSVLLGGAGGLAAAVAAGCSGGSSPAVPVAATSPGKPSGAERTVDVAIVGAGLAGLTAARELVRRGNSVVVLEARDRVGGRLLNHDLGNGVITEVGGQYIGPTQDRIAALAAAVGVGTFPTYNSGSNVLLLKGKRSTYPATGLPTDPSVASDLLKIVSELDGMAKTVPVERPWTAARAAEWDSQTLETYLQRTVRNPGARTLVDAAIKSLWGGEARDLSLLYVLFYVAAAGNNANPGSFLRLVSTAGGAQEKRFVGGSQKVALKVAAALGDRVVLSAPVRRIEQAGSSVVVTHDRGRVRAGRVVVAVPPSLTTRIDWAPVLPGRRAQLAQRAPQGSLIKAEVVYDKPFWRDAKLSGQAVADTGLARSTFDTLLARAVQPYCSGSSAAPKPAAGQTSPTRSVARRYCASLPCCSGRRRSRRRTTSRRTGRPRSGPAAAQRRSCRPACCSSTAARCASRSAGCTGPAPRPQRTGTATWTARCAPGSGWRLRSRQRSECRSRQRSECRSRQRSECRSRQRSECRSASCACQPVVGTAKTTMLSR